MSPTHTFSAQQTHTRADERRVSHLAKVHDEVHEVAVGRRGIAEAVREQLGDVQLLLDSAVESFLSGRQAAADLYLELERTNKRTSAVSAL
jgi:hypothetical protein